MFSKLHEDSRESVSSQLDVFAVPFSQTSVLKGEWVEYASIRPPNSSGPLEFQIDASSQYYTDLDNTLLQIQARVLKADGTRISNQDANVTVSPTPNLLHSLFSSLTLSLNGHQVEFEPNYAHRAYLEDYINSGEGAKKTYMEASIWTEDEMGVLDTADLAALDLDGAQNPRIKYLKNSRIMDMIGKIHCALGNQANFIPTNISLFFKFLFNDPSFYLTKLTNTDTDNYKLEIMKANILVRRLTIHPSIVVSHHKLLAAGKKMVFPLRNVQTQMFTISPGRHSETITLIQNQQSPKRVIIGLLKHTAQNGSYTECPFNFRHFNVSSISLTQNGRPILGKPLEMNFTTGAVTQAYIQFNMAVGKAWPVEGNGISLKKFQNGSTLYGYDLTPDLCEGRGMHLIENGTTAVELTFETATTATISLFAYFERDDILSIDNNRVIQLASTA